MSRLLIALAIVGLAACAQAPVAPPQVSEPAGESFAEYGARFVDELMTLNPGWATAVGDYRFVERLSIPDAADRARREAFADRHLAALDAFPPASLTPDQRADRAMIQNYLRFDNWQRSTLRRWQWNPAQYNVAGGFDRLLNTDFAPEKQRLLVVSERLESVPAYYAAARANIHLPTREHTQLAIEQNRGALSVFDPAVLVPRFEAAVDCPVERGKFRAALDAARTAIQDYLAWLESIEPTLVGDRARSFRLGNALYEPLFDFQIQAGTTAMEMFDRAVAERDRMHAEMAEIAAGLWPGLFPDTPMPADPLERIATVIAHLSKHHVAPGEFVDEVRRQIRELEAFVAERELLDIDTDKPLVVRETPAYQRGVSIASIDAPGPFDPGANTYYNVTPMDRFTPEQAESFLREYNHWVLQVLNIHEAVPGHYTQLVHANKSPSVVKALLGNGAMIEGWAVYAERMMLENGWGFDAPEMWLMWGKWYLRVVCNTILDYGVHVLDMREDEAMDLLMNQAFQTETEARGKWRRVQLSQVQLTSYFAGYSAIWALRERLRAEQGADFDLRSFHNRFLGYGNAPVALIEQLMTEGE